MANQKQVLDVQVSEGITTTQNNEHLCDRSGKTEKYAMSKGNYDPTRKRLNFEIAPGGKIHPIDTSRSIPKWIADILSHRGIKDPNEGLLELKHRTVVSIIFGGSRQRMQELAFGTQQVDFEKGTDNTHVEQKRDIGCWAKDVYSFVCGRYGEQNTTAFIVHLDELNPYIHCTLLPIKDSRFAYKEIFAGKGEFEYSAGMKQLHTDFFAEINTKWGISKGTSISETDTRHRTTGEYRRMLSGECITIEDNIKLHQQVLGELQSDIRLAERRVKGLTTMVNNLEKQKTEKEILLPAAEYNLKGNKSNAVELATQIQMLEKELQGITRQLTDRQEKLQAADRQPIELKEDMGAIEECIEELEEEAYQYSRDVHSRVDSLFKDILLESVISGYHNTSTQMNVSERQLFDGSLVQPIAERDTEIMYYAIMLFLGMVDDATTFAKSHGGGGGGGDLKWGHDEDGDNRAWILRCMRMASRMMRSTIGKKSKQ